MEVGRIGGENTECGGEGEENEHLLTSTPPSGE
jgi:hypothetical protein